MVNKKQNFRYNQSPKFSGEYIEIFIDYGLESYTYVKSGLDKIEILIKGKYD